MLPDASRLRAVVSEGSTVAVKRVSHSELQAAMAPMFRWTVDRVLPDVYVGVSVQDNADGNVSVAIWGAMTDADVVTQGTVFFRRFGYQAVQDLHQWPPRDATARVSVPLSAFSGALYRKLRGRLVGGQ